MRTLSLSLLLLSVAACAPRVDTWERVSANPTRPALRRYIHEHPGTEEAQIARLHLERLSARQALADGGIAALALHLQAHPSGAHAAEVRDRLVALRAKRALTADTPWALLRFLYLHPEPKEAAGVRARLEGTWWRELQAAPTPRGLKQYLEVFPGGAHEAAAQELLASVLFERLGAEPDPELLRVFALNHAKSQAGRRALELIRELERAEALAVGDAAVVAELAAGGQRLPEDLLRVAVEAHLEAALWDFDLDRLQLLCAGAPKHCDPRLPPALVHWRKLNPANRDKLAATVRAAGPFRPMAALRSLEVALGVEDLQTVWAALGSLSHRPEPRAFGLLLSRAGHPDPAVAWPAADACRAWFARWPARGAVLAAFELRRRTHRLDQYPTLAQATLLAELLGRPLPTDHLARAKPAEPVTLATLVLQVQTLPAAPWNALANELGTAVTRLRDLFPGNLDRESFPLARNLARRLYRLQVLLESLRAAPGPFAATVSERLAQVQSLLSDWEGRLAAFPGYLPSAEDPLAAQKSAHLLAREAARTSLLKAADPFGGAWWKIPLGVPTTTPPAGGDL